METLRDSVFANLVSELIIVILGVLVANFVQRKFRQWRYGGWHLEILEAPLPGAESTSPEKEMAGHNPSLYQRDISPDTAHRIFHDERELDVFLKGRISPFANVNCDLITELDSKSSPVIAKNERSRKITVTVRSPKITPRNEGNKDPHR